MEKKDFGKLFLGSILIIAGLFAVLANFFKLTIFGVLFLPTLGLLFIIWSIILKEEELIIPGGIIGGVGLGILFINLFENVNDISKGGLFFIGFSIGWILITIISKLIFKKTILWPLIPSSILFILGIILFLGDKGIIFLQNFSLIWPYLLIIGGFFIILKSFIRKK
ncbi:MAG: hypothetical protein QMD25_00445 [Caldisericia bacterium]|jgi:hypothetical protein|nr:hypothetical protein [Caldisericia bacterium]